MRTLPEEIGQPVLRRCAKVDGDDEREVEEVLRVFLEQVLDRLLRQTTTSAQSSSVEAKVKRTNSNFGRAVHTRVELAQEPDRLLRDGLSDGVEHEEEVLPDILRRDGLLREDLKVANACGWVGEFEGGGLAELGSGGEVGEEEEAHLEERGS